MSSTYKKDGRGLFLPYGSGIVLGFMSNDVLHFGDLVVPGQVFGEVTVEPGQVWVESPFDGLLGMGYPLLALPPGVLPPFDQIMKVTTINSKATLSWLTTTCNPNHQSAQASEERRVLGLPLQQARR